MSIKVMTEVWEFAPCMGTELLILLGLADMANDDRECWPSMKTVAKKGRITERQTGDVLSELELQGFIDIIHRKDSKGSNLSNLYHIKPVSDWLLLSIYSELNPTDACNTPLLMRATPPYYATKGENVVEPSLNPNKNLNTNTTPTASPSKPKQKPKTKPTQQPTVRPSEKKAAPKPRKSSGLPYWLSKLPAVKPTVTAMLAVCYENWDSIMMTAENSLTVNQLEKYITGAEEFERLGGKAGDVASVFDFVDEQVDHMIAPKTLADYFLRWKAAGQIIATPLQTQPIIADSPNGRNEPTAAERAEMAANIRAARPQALRAAG